MRLLFITRKYPPAIGGMEMFAKDLSDALSAKTDLKLIKWSGYGQLKALLVGVPLLTLKATGALLTSRFDIIHVQDGVLAPVGWLLSRIFRKPFTVVIHGLDITFTNPLFKTVVPWAVRRADVVFCISQAAADEVLKCGVATDKVAVIPIAVKDNLYDKRQTKSDLCRRLGLPNDVKILLTVGRLVKRKGAAWFVGQVLPELVKQYPTLVYLVVGDGKDRGEVEAAVAAAKMEPYVKLLGRVEDDLYQLVYNGADIFVTPNINVPGDIEGFGLVNLEAALCELPVVAADTEGIRDAISNGRNGVMVTVEDKESFIKQIGYFLDHPAEAERFGERARQFTLHNFNWPALADRYIEHYQAIAKRHQTP